MQPLGLPGRPVRVLTGRLPRLAADAVHDPDANGTKNSTVDQVDGEGVMAEPDQKAMRKELLQGGRDGKSEGDAHDEEAGSTTARLGALRNQETAPAAIAIGIDDQAMQPHRPTSPILVLMGVGADKTADEKKQRSDNPGKQALVLRDEVLSWAVLGEFS